MLYSSVYSGIMSRLFDFPLPRPRALPMHIHTYIHTHTYTQARRLVSQALRRNISRGENNLALAEKLQQYLGLLRNELARVRQGDVLLATKILDAHRARTTAATSAATGAAVAVAVAPAPVHSSAAELPLPSPPPPREEQRSVGSLFSGQVPGPPTVVSGMLPAPPGDVAKVNRKPSSGGRGGHVEAVTCTATSAVHGAAGDSGLRGPGSPAFTPAAIALSAHHVGNAVAADAASSTSGSSISTSSPTSSPTSSLTANASSSREESIQGTTVQDQAEWEGEVCNGINGKMSDHGNIVSINRGGGSHVCSGGGGGGGGSDCGPDAASGLSRLFSRTRVLELPGDDTAVATGPQHFAPPQPSASTPLTSPLTTRSASLSSTADVDPPLFVAIAGYDTVCDADTPTAAAGAAAAAIVQGHDGGDSGGDGDGDGRPTAAGVSGPSSETTAAGSSCGGDLGSGTAAASGTQRLGLDAVRRLSDDSESARSTLMGLLSPAGAIPGPLQLAAAATAGSEAVSGYGSSPGYADSKWRGGGGGEHSGGREARAHSGRGGGNDDTQGNARAVVGGCSGSHPRTGTERIHPDELAAPTEPVPPSTSPTSPTSLSSSSEGLYALAGERVPSRRMRIQAPSASAAATKAAVAAAAADAAAAAADCVIGQGPPHASDRAGGEPATTGRELRALMVLLASMVSELRRRGYVGCEEQMDLAAAQLEQLLALSRGEVAAAAAAAAATARGRRSSPR
ncbi:hypothetical protein VaNZ11_003886 [Volvox africanus]|uniref:Uncharacterized protein n=1 Tax=Volvox africanus TaxID=51714 RepID=A0ABQ5RW89_9CHLO|nr:hypothetical protein VaNZ11_003886 [Volvox africanus]